METDKQNIERAQQPKVLPGERPLKCFISSVTKNYQWARDEIASTLGSFPFITPWAFEYTPGSSEPLDKGNLRHVRESDFVFWLVTFETSSPVFNEVQEAILNKKRILVVLIDTEDTWSLETKNLIKDTGTKAKWIDPKRHSSLSEAIEMTMRDEIVRALRGNQGMERYAYLEDIAKQSYARCITRWIAAGVSRKEAIRMAKDLNIGKPPREVIPTAKKPLVILINEFGSGKSLTAERLLQQAISNIAKTSTCPIPIYLQAQEIEGSLMKHILRSVSGLGEPRTRGVFLVIDGADEAGVINAFKLINEARTLVECWQNTLIFITSRPISAIEKAEEICRLPTLSEKEAYDLINLIAGRDVPISITFRLPESVREAIKRPLFAILVGRFIRESKDRIPQSTGELLSTLIESSLLTSNLSLHRANPILCKLAVELIERDGGYIPINEIGKPDIVEELLSTGLLVSKNKTLTFALPIFTHWFTAQAFSEKLIDSKSISLSREIDKWKYPLIIAVGIFNHDLVTSILEPIIKSDPGIASEIVEEGLANWGLEEDILPPTPKVAAKRIRDSMKVWISAIGNIYKLIAPINKENKLMPLGAKTSGAYLMTGWYAGTEDREPVEELPKSVTFFSRQFEWVSLRSARPGQQSAWAWRWSRDELRDNLEHLLEKRKLKSNILPFIHEELYYSATALLDFGSLCSEDIDISKIKRKLSEYSRNTTLIKSGNYIDIQNMWFVIEQYEKINPNILKAPYPGPDKEYSKTKNFVWSSYSDNQLLLRTQAVYKAAIEIYIALVKEWFEVLSQRLCTNVTLPAILKGYLYIPTEQKFLNKPTIFWYLHALPKNAKTILEFTLSLNEIDHKSFDGISEFNHLRSMRPEASKWISFISHDSFLYVFNKFPARELAYVWLSNDLTRLHWLKHSIYPGLI